MVDDSAHPYVAVWTSSTDYPTTAGVFDRTHNSPGVMDLAFSKLKPDGSGLVYSTFIGGSKTEQARGSIAVDAAGNLYSSGWTDSPDFPTTPGAFQRSLKGGADAFLLKLSADGSRLIFSTLFGGSASDQGYTRVAVHSDGTIYFSGTTRSRDLPVSTNAFQMQYGGDINALNWHGDAFVTRFSADGSHLLYSTYLGGSSGEEASVNNSFSVDPAGHAIVLGNTTSTNFPVSISAYQTSNRGGQFGDAFVAILSADGSQLVASTLLGGTGSEESSGLAIDASGRIFLSGNTASTDYPVTPDAFGKTFRGGVGNVDACFSILSSNLSALIYSTYLAGSGTAGGFGDRGRAVALDPAGAIVITGDSNSPDFPIAPNVYQTQYRGAVDAFVVKITNAPPHLTLSPLTNGCVTVRLHGSPGQIYRLETSGGLSTWRPATPNQAGVASASLERIDCDAGSQTSRFYRAN